MPTVVCPSCRKKFRPPDHLAGRRVTCPRCNDAVQVPVDLPESVQDLPASDPSEPVEEPPLPRSVRMGMLSLGMGLVSILILCLPILGYLAFVLSGAGVILGTGGLLYARFHGGESLPPQLAGGAGIWGRFGSRVIDYPLAGVVACLFALALALLPYVMP